MVGRLAVKTFVGLAPIAVAAAWPAVVRADLFLVFTRGQAAVGQRVEAVSGDRRGPQSLPPVRGIRLYLVPMARAKSPKHQTSTGPPTDPTWLPFGRLRHPHPGVYKVSFVIPHVAPGSYTIGFWCVPCAPPRGATFTGAYPGHVATGRPFTKILRVTASHTRDRDSRPEASPGDGSSSRATPVIAAVAGLAILLSALAGIRFYTRRS
jgi:hypothetical protein